MLAGLVFAIIVFAAASSGAFFKPDEWYAGLRKPSWTPPPIAFPIVWTTLYLMIAAAGWLVWREAGMSAPLAAWAVQIVLNAMWSWFFFGLRRPALAFVEVVVLLASIVVFIVLAQPVSATAALLFVPYLAWVATAAALNLRILQLNPRRWGYDAERSSIRGETAT